MQTDPFGVTVDPALITALAERDEHRRRSLAALVARDVAQRAADQAHVRAAVLAYAATSHLPVGHAAASRPAI